MWLQRVKEREREREKRKSVEEIKRWWKWSKTWIELIIVSFDWVNDSLIITIYAKNHKRDAGKCTFRNFINYDGRLAQKLGDSRGISLEVSMDHSAAVSVVFSPVRQKKNARSVLESKPWFSRMEGVNRPHEFSYLLGPGFQDVEAPLISNLFARRRRLEYLSLHFKSHPRASGGVAASEARETGEKDGWG